MYVVSVNGLNLRSAPTTQSSIIRALPFLTKVVFFDKNEAFVSIDGIISQWYKIKIENDIGWVFGGYLSEDINIPKVNGKNFIEVYRYRSVSIKEGGFGFEEILARIRKSYLVIYETSGKNRYIYDDEGLIDYIPRFGDGVGRSEYTITGILSEYMPYFEDNNNLADTILITFYRANQNENRIFEFSIIYERIRFQ
jgi:hypothetical protein